LVELTISDEPSSWAALGFEAPGGVLELGGVQLTLGSDRDGIGSWSLSGIAPTDAIDGLPTTVVEPRADDGGGEGLAHPNGAIGLDHVVVTTPDFDRTAQALEAAGMPLRRIRTAWQGERSFRQGFRRLGPAILEVVEVATPHTPTPEDPARFWGLVVIVEDIDALAERLGPERCTAPKDAVQPGRRIATLRSTAGLSPALAFMTPE
jgi:hypothetical protein